VHTQVIGPDHDAEKAFPKGQFEKANRKKSGGKPKAACECVLNNLDFLRFSTFLFRIPISSVWRHAASADWPVAKLMMMGWTSFL
jgi:hypothetical protein